jgi:hypothetical protein
MRPVQRAWCSSISVVWRSACETLAFVGSGSLPKVVWDARSSRRQGMASSLPVPVPDSSMVRRWHWARSELPAEIDPGIMVLTALRLGTRRFEPGGGGPPVAPSYGARPRSGTGEPWAQVLAVPADSTRRVSDVAVSPWARIDTPASTTTLQNTLTASV